MAVEQHGKGSAVERFRSDQRGSIGILFALVLMPLALLSAFAIESNRASEVRQSLQTAADAAAEAVVSRIGERESDLRMQMRMTIDANLGPELKGIEFQSRIDTDARTVEVAMTTDVATPLLSVAGRSRTTVSVTGNARQPEPRIGLPPVTVPPSSRPPLAAVPARPALEELARQPRREPSPEDIRRAEAAMREIVRQLQQNPGQLDQLRDLMRR